MMVLCPIMDLDGLLHPEKNQLTIQEVIGYRNFIMRI
jgi:hypothetical protein